ncbi:phage GP46 family protein [Ancylobacter sp. WKF20]|uniref:phage GP46 family protein n=1 Tax=Ancylobacter sp. WKF20 TaxID=3039801 RepID=UPI0024341EE0|nr:phage GP46 family protein [Ancylobacter sp. WKF20]WGD31196.1 phage GP46 family protein [Ancylobacter sp. WKF20]
MRIVPITQAQEPVRIPDLIWNPLGFIGDLALNASTADLQSGAAIETAVLICLMTDRRVDASELPEGESNRGWPGDGFDRQRGEAALGSKLWLLRRRALTEDIDTEAEDYAREALQTLIDQGVCVRVEVTVERRPADNRLDLEVRLFGRDGTATYQRRFAVLWDQIDARG